MQVHYAEGKGEAEPLTTNDTESGRAEFNVPTTLNARQV